MHSWDRTFILLHPASRSLSCDADCSARAGDSAAAAAAVAARAGTAGVAVLLLGLLRLFFPMVRSTTFVNRVLLDQRVCRVEERVQAANTLYLGWGSPSCCLSIRGCVCVALASS